MCSHYLRSHFVLKSLLNKGRIEFLVMEDPLKVYASQRSSPLLVRVQDADSER